MAMTLLKQATFAVRLIWDFTESNFFTFIIPNTAFGVLDSLAAPILIEDHHQHQNNAPSALDMLQRVLATLLFNWIMTLIFDLSNQRGPESVVENMINKPWRPIPTGKATAEQARRATLVAVPAALVLCYCLDVWGQGTVILILTWLYNDLKGCDELVRDPTFSVAFAMFNSASLQIASGPRSRLSGMGVAWTVVISSVILTTMKVQDLKDQAGDGGRGRRTVPLFLGDQVSRISIAVFVCFWSFACAYFWRLALWAYAVSAWPGAVVALRVLCKRTSEEDARTWKWWCLWTVTLYSLPAYLLFPLVEIRTFGMCLLV